jgi:dTDP-4-dehydrorhamnose 3,5-epimerase
MTDHSDLTETNIFGCFLFSSPIHEDSRGSFREWYKTNPRFGFDTKQGNFSISDAGVLRGMHFSIGIHSQAKVVTCVSGEIQDVLVDLRITSPTFKEVVSVSLSPSIGNSLLIAPGVAHGFLSLADGSAVVYLASEIYNPGAERSFNAEDPLLDGVWSRTGFTRSQKDQEAPFLSGLSFDW